MVKAKTFVAKKQYDGHVTEDNFELIEEEVPAIDDGEFLMETLCLSVDPYMRAHAHVHGLALNKKMFGQGTGRVIESKNPDYPVGTILTGDYGWTTHVKSSEAFLKNPFFQRVPEGISPSNAMGVLGLTGLTAYFGLLDICNPKEGETVFVNAAAGAVGNVVGQIAKIKGCRVVGCAGSEEKLKYLKEIGFDGVFNYKTVTNFEETLKELCPKGIDCFFENVGGDMFGVVVNQMNRFGRIAICGFISSYNDKDMKQAKGSNIHGHMIFKELKMQGFLVPSYHRRFPEGIQAITQWIQEGKLKVREHIMEGFENMPKALMALFTGDNIGKLLVKV